jgi:iron(III) transport system ATP-binding protein
MVFQDYALFPHMSVERNIKYGLSKEVKKDKRVREVLALVNMQGYERRYPHELSGGQQQRIALARAIAPQPELLLLDEPFSSLDFDLQLKIREELKEILKQANMTTILVTHNRENCKSIADEIIELKNGEITNNNWGIA